MLPDVFQNPINKKIDNVQDSYRGKINDKKEYTKDDINKKINEIFSSANHVYKSKVKIVLNDKIVEEQIVGRSKNNLLTLNGKIINISEIQDIIKM